MHVRNRRPGPARQKGYVGLIAIFIALAFIGALTVVYWQIEQRRFEQAWADAEGAALAQLALGLRGYVARIQADGTLNAPDWNPVLFNGVNRLKPPSCGGHPTNPPEGYVPCTFLGGTMGAQYQSRVTSDLSTGFVEVRTSVQVPTLGGRPDNRIMLAERVTEAALRHQATAATGTFFQALANTVQTATAPAPAAVRPNATAMGRVTIIVSNAPSNDIYLRRDGTNNMQANLNMGGFSLGNALDARFDGDVRVEGRVQVDDGLTVTSGTADLRGGVIAPDAVWESLGVFASQGIYRALVLTGSNQYLVDKPDCSEAGNSPAIYASFQSTGSINYDGTYRADSMYDASIDVQDQGSRWLVTPRVRGTRFDLGQAGTDIVFEKSLHGVEPTDSRIVVMTRCR
jgi:hypothetical protein